MSVTPTTMDHIYGNVAGSVTNQLLGSFKASSDKLAWYDFWNYLYVFPEEYTELINNVLMNDSRATINSYILTGHNRKVPGEGCHKFKYAINSRWWQYITFEKKKGSDGNSYYYLCYATRRGTSTLMGVANKVFTADNGLVRVISIDRSRQQGPFPLYLDKICGRERMHQTSAIDHILDNWGANKFNRKVVISGPRGSGKSYIARLLKKRIDNQTRISRLYDDFNPMCPGLSVNLLVLQNAKSYTPVILLIDEIDISYKNATESEMTIDQFGRFGHAATKQSLNEMLDSISDTMYVLAIYTTEKTPEELYKNKEWHSFMRPGRVDFFLKMTPHSCRKIEHMDVAGYTPS